MKKTGRAFNVMGYKIEEIEVLCNWCGQYTCDDSKTCAQEIAKFYAANQDKESK